MRISNPKDMGGSPLLTKVYVTSGVLSGEGTVSSPLTFDETAISSSAYPSISGNAGKALMVNSDGTGVEWGLVNTSTDDSIGINCLCFKIPTISSDKYLKLTISFYDDENELASTYTTFANQSLFKVFNGDSSAPSFVAVSSLTTAGILDASVSEQSLIFNASSVVADWFTWHWDECNKSGTSLSTGELGASRLDASLQIFDVDLSDRITGTQLDSKLENYVTSAVLTTVLDDYAKSSSVDEKQDSITSDSKLDGSLISGSVASATYATTAGVANSVNASNVSGVVASATYATEAGKISGSKVSGAVSSATYATKAGQLNASVKIGSASFDGSSDITISQIGAIESSVFADHYNDSTRHITEAERTAWNAKSELSIEVAASTASITSPSSKVIYLVSASTSGTNNIYDEYVYVGNKFEKIGTTQADLTNYVQKDGDKVLTDVNFTSALLGKLNGIESGATKVVVDTTIKNSSNAVANSAVSAALDGKVSTSVTVNGNALSGNISITADEIAISDSDNTTVSASIAGKQDKITSDNKISGSLITGAVSSATYATTAGTANSVSGVNVSGTVSSATYATTAGNVTGVVTSATYATSATNAAKLTNSVNIGNASFNGASSITLAQIGAASSATVASHVADSAIHLPTGGSAGDCLKKTDDGVAWATLSFDGGSAIEDFSSSDQAWDSSDAEVLHRYTGTTTSSYENGGIYRVNGETVTTSESYEISYTDGSTGSDTFIGEYEDTGNTTTVDNVNYPVYSNGTYYIFYAYSPAALVQGNYWILYTSYSNSFGATTATAYSGDGETWTIPYGSTGSFSSAYTVTHNAGGTSTSYTAKKILVDGDVTSSSGTTINNLCFKAPSISADKYAKLVVDFKNDSNSTVSSWNSYSNSSSFKVFNGTSFIGLNTISPYAGVLNNNYSDQAVLVDISSLSSTATWFTYRWDGCNSAGSSDSTGDTGASRLDAAVQIFDTVGENSSGVTQADLTEALSDYVTSADFETTLADYVKSDDIANGIESFSDSTKSFTSTDVGKMFFYNGTTSGKFINGKYYGVFAKTTTTDETYVISSSGNSGSANSYESAKGTYTKTSYTTTVDNVTYPVYSNGTYYIFYAYSGSAILTGNYWFLYTTYSSTFTQYAISATAYSSNGTTWSSMSATFGNDYVITKNAGGTSTTYNAIPMSLDQSPVEEATSSSAYTVYPGRNAAITCSADTTLSADAGIDGFIGYVEIDLILGSGISVSAGTNMTLVDTPTSGKTNHCIVRWYGTSARLFVIDSE